MAMTFTPDLATPISQLAAAAKANDWPLEVKDGLIGSCTNSSYEDMSRVASLMKQVWYSYYPHLTKNSL